MKRTTKSFVDHMVDGQLFNQSGTFTPSHFLVSRKQPTRLSRRIQVYAAKRPIAYQGKLKSDGLFWLKIENGYLCVANSKKRLYGHDSNSNWGVNAPGPATNINRSVTSKISRPQQTFVAAEPLLFRTAAEWTATSKGGNMLSTGDMIVYSNILKEKGIFYIQTSQGFLPYRDCKSGKRYGFLSNATLANSLEFHPTPAISYQMNGQFCFSRRSVNVYQRPDLTSYVIDRLPKKTVVAYTGKLVDKHRGWLQLNQHGQPRYVPFMTRYPNDEHYFGYEVTGSKSVTRLVEPWTFDRANKPISLPPTKLEQAALKQVTQQLQQVRQPDSIVIGLINDTHYDAHQSLASQRSLSDLLMISQLAATHHFDGLVVNGDLVDGNQTLNRTIIDTGDAVSALKEASIPTFITQGNHDDNSGFARYLNGYRTEQVLTEKTAANLRQQFNIHWLAEQHHFYGKYKVPGTALSLIMLNTFDIRDSSSDTYFDRDYIDQPNGIHWTGILQNIRHSRSRIERAQATWLSQTLNQLKPDEQAIVFTHDSIRSAIDKQAVQSFWTYDWFANNQQGYFASVYNSLIKHRQQIVAVMSGHTHVDDWSTQDGINWITTTSDITDRRKTSRLDSHALGAWDVLVINPKQRQLFRLRYGWHDRAGRIRNWQYRLFGDGTDTNHRSLKAIFKPTEKQPLTGNALYYQNQNKQVDQIWRGFRGYFDY